jgi:hypothetical protein
MSKLLRLIPDLIDSKAPRSSALHLTINLKKRAISKVHKFEKSFLGKEIMGFH